MCVHPSHANKSAGTDVIHVNSSESKVKPMLKRTEVKSHAVVAESCVAQDMEKDHPCTQTSPPPWEKVRGRLSALISHCVKPGKLSI